MYVQAYSVENISKSYNLLDCILSMTFNLMNFSSLFENVASLEIGIQVPEGSWKYMNDQVQ